MSFRLIRNIDRGLRLSVGGEDFGGRALQPLTRVRDVKQKNVNVEEHQARHPSSTHVTRFEGHSLEIGETLGRKRGGQGEGRDETGWTGPGRLAHTPRNGFRFYGFHKSNLCASTCMYVCMYTYIHTHIRM